MLTSILLHRKARVTKVTGDIMHEDAMTWKHFPHYWSFVMGNTSHTGRDHSVYAPGQWATALHCNAVSHWLGTYREWLMQSRAAIGHRCPTHKGPIMRNYHIFVVGNLKELLHKHSSCRWFETHGVYNTQRRGSVLTEFGYRCISQHRMAPGHQ